MSTNGSRPAGASQRRRPDYRHVIVAALCALSCCGDIPWRVHLATAQDENPPATLELAPAEATPATPPVSTPEAAPQATAEAPAASATISEMTPIPDAAATPEVSASPDATSPNAQADNPPPQQNAPNGSKKTVPLSLDEMLERRVRLELREGSLADWMLAIQKEFGVDMVYDSAELQRINADGKFTDKPLKTVLETILGSKGYGYRRGENNVLEILPREELGEILPNQRRELIRMKYVTPADVEQSLNLLKSPKGKVITIPSAKTLMVVDYPDNIQKIREHVKEMDELAREAVEKQQQEERQRQQMLPSTTVGPNASAQPTIAPDVQPVEQTITTTIYPKFVLADNLVDAVQTQMGDGTVTSIEETNALVLTGHKSAVQAAVQTAKSLDILKKQVRITVLMYDIRIEALEQLGVNWRNAGKGRLNANGFPQTFADLNSSPQNLGVTSSTTTSSSGSGSTPGTPSTGTGGTTGSSTTSTTTTAGAGLGSFVTSAAPNIVGSAFTLQHLSRHFDLSAVFLALDQTDGARLLASPSIVCLDRKQAEMKIISEIPVQQLTQTDRGGNIGTTTFREAGVTLTVMPEIGDDGVVKLTLSPEFSVLTGFQNGQPIIDRRNQTTTLAVQSGETLVLGGLRRRNELETVSGIPGLMNLKYVGMLFRAHRTSVEESELITFIRTEIVDTCYSGYLREQVAAQIVGETLDQICIAGHSPYMPPCNDPYCPIHNPRPKYWEGNMIYPEPPPPGYPGGAPPPLQPRHQSPVYETLPPVQGHAPDGSGIGTQNGDLPVKRLPPAPTPPAPTPPAQAPPVPMNDVEEYESRDHEDPPPVKIDETARLRSGNRLILFRLPKVTPEPTLQPIPPAGGLAPTDAARIARQPNVTPLPPTQNQPTQQAPAPQKSWQQLFR